jgi:hypothetical protein
LILRPDFDRNTPSSLCKIINSLALNCAGLSGIPSLYTQRVVSQTFWRALALVSTGEHPRLFAAVLFKVRISTEVIFQDLVLKKVARLVGDHSSQVTEDLKIGKTGCGRRRKFSFTGGRKLECSSDIFLAKAGKVVKNLILAHTSSGFCQVVGERSSGYAIRIP